MPLIISEGNKSPAVLVLIPRHMSWDVMRKDGLFSSKGAVSVAKSVSVAVSIVLARNTCHRGLYKCY